MSTVSRPITYSVVDSGGNEGAGKVMFRYDAEKPLQVELDFGPHADGRGPNVWTVARDVIARKVEGHDARCWVDGLWFHLRLDNPNGVVHLQLLAAQVSHFLGDTKRLVPYGAERIDFDAELTSLLTGGGR